MAGSFKVHRVKRLNHSYFTWLRYSKNVYKYFKKTHLTKDVLNYDKKSNPNTNATSTNVLRFKVFLSCAWWSHFETWRVLYKIGRFVIVIQNTSTLIMLIYTEAEWRIYTSVNLPIFGSDNGLSPARHQAIMGINDINEIFNLEQTSVKFESNTKLFIQENE